VSQPLLVVEKLSKSFGEERALDGIDLVINEGEIRCLAGENGSGKSTFVKIVSGVYAATEGRITVSGHEITENDPRAAIAAGVQVIYQDLSLFDHLTVAENIAINAMLHEGSHYVNRRQMHEIAAKQLERIRVDLPLDTRVGSLSVANKQIVAIARALSMDAKLLFMDEPTTALTTKEVKRLLTIVHELKEDGLAVVFISHKLDEVFDVADTITVFRDGKKVGDFAADELNSASLSFHMTGREVLHKAYQREPREDDGTRAPLLEVKDLTRKGNYENVNFDVRPGDIVGLTGLLGAGRTELALSLYGLNKPDSGEIRMDGKRVRIDNPWDALDRHIALVPEDRGVQGLFLEQSIASNSSAPKLDSLLTKFRLLDTKAEQKLARHTVDYMAVNNKNIDALVGILSGGNQQKVVIGKWIATEPKVFILDSPTVGIDIGSKAEIYEHIQALAKSGIGVILISDEPEEIYVNCNRVIVMHEGDVIAKFNEEERNAPDFQEHLAEVVANPTNVATNGATGVK